MKVITSVELWYGYKDMEHTFNDVDVNEYNMGDIDFSLTYSYIYLLRLF